LFATDVFASCRTECSDVQQLVAPSLSITNVPRDSHVRRIYKVAQGIAAESEERSDILVYLSVSAPPPEHIPVMSAVAMLSSD